MATPLASIPICHACHRSADTPAADVLPMVATRSTDSVCYTCWACYLGERRANEDTIPCYICHQCPGAKVYVPDVGYRHPGCVETGLDAWLEAQDPRAALAARGLPPIAGGALNDYEQRQLARQERLEARAARAAHEADAAAKQSHDMMKAIPFGQPILVGHHSEGRDRRYRDRAWNLLGKSVEQQHKAETLAQRAAAVGTGGISQDDPDAITKLEAKRATEEAHRDRCKAVNVLLRGAKIDTLVKARDAGAVAEALQTLDLTDTERKGLVDQLRYFGRMKLDPSYHTREIARINERIAQLQRQATTSYPTLEGAGWLLEDDTDRNRLRLTITYRLPRETFDWLRSMGWRWARTEQAFLAYRNGSAYDYARREFAERLDASR